LIYHGVGDLMKNHYGRVSVTICTI